MVIIGIIAALLVGVAIGYALFRYVVKQKYNQYIKDGEDKARLFMEKAKDEAENMKKDKLLEVKEKFINKKAELEKEVSARNQKLQQAENKLKQREISLNQRHEHLQASTPEKRNSVDPISDSG